MNAAPKLLEENAELKQKVSYQEQQIESQKHRIQILEEMLRLANIKQFGASSEKGESLQQPLFNEAEEQLKEDHEDVTADDAVTVPAHTRFCFLRACAGTVTVSSDSAS